MMQKFTLKFCKGKSQSQIRRKLKRSKIDFSKNNKKLKQQLKKLLWRQRLPNLKLKHSKKTSLWLQKTQMLSRNEMLFWIFSLLIWFQRSWMRIISPDNSNWIERRSSWTGGRPEVSMAANEEASSIDVWVSRAMLLKQAWTVSTTLFKKQLKWWKRTELEAALTATTQWA